jgi:hypothetical protein
LRRLAGLAAILAFAACAPQTARLPAAPIPAGPGIRVTTAPVPESSAAVAASRFAWAGGLVLTSADTSRLHGLSDLVVQPDGRFTSISDEGDLVTGRITLDAQGRLSGVADMALTPLIDTDGRPLSGRKAEGDSEGLAIWPNGDRMVSFEARNDILLYPLAGGPPRKVPRPESDFPFNDGMEALAPDPASGPDAYLVGREDTRQTWTCRLAGGCVARFVVPQHGPGKLVSARPMPGGGWVFLLRDFQPLAGNTIWIVITDAAGREIDVHEIKRPMTVDNIEGVAPVSLKGGKVRLYLISDDNFSAGQKTLLLAFDWTPPPTRGKAP